MLSIITRRDGESLTGTLTLKGLVKGLFVKYLKLHVAENFSTPMFYFFKFLSEVLLTTNVITTPIKVGAETHLVYCIKYQRVSYWNNQSVKRLVSIPNTGIA